MRLTERKTPWAAEARKGPGPLPRPRQGIDLKKLRLESLPGNKVAAIWQHADSTIQAGGAVPVDFHQSNGLRRAGFRENHRQAETAGLMTNHRFTPTLLLGKAAANRAVDTDVKHLAASFFLPERHQDAVFRAAAVFINHHAGSTAVAGEYLSPPPGPVNIRRDIILKQPDGFHLVKNGLFAATVAKLKRVLKIQHLIKANCPFRFQLLEQIPGLKQYVYPVGLERPKDYAPKPGTGGTSTVRSDTSSLESHHIPVNKRWLPLQGRNRLSVLWGGIRQDWMAAYRLLWLLNRRVELQRLIAWAERKKLAGPKRCYEKRLNEAEEKLLRYSLRFPGPVKLAFLLHRINGWFFPAPCYLRRGAARDYSRRYAKSARTQA